MIHATFQQDWSQVENALAVCLAELRHDTSLTVRLGVVIVAEQRCLNDIRNELEIFRRVSLPGQLSEKHGCLFRQYACLFAIADVLSFTYREQFG